jgi:hypothetical protein
VNQNNEAISRQCGISHRLIDGFLITFINGVDYKTGRSFMYVCSHPSSSHNPINCIIPPHMLEVMAMRGDKSVAKMARSMLAQNEKVRSERAEQSSGGMVPIGWYSWSICEYGFSRGRRATTYL